MWNSYFCVLFAQHNIQSTIKWPFIIIKVKPYKTPFLQVIQTIPSTLWFLMASSMQSVLGLLMHCELIQNCLWVALNTRMLNSQYFDHKLNKIKKMGLYLEVVQAIVMKSWQRKCPSEYVSCKSWNAEEVHVLFFLSRASLPSNSQRENTHMYNARLTFASIFSTTLSWLFVTVCVHVRKWRMCKCLHSVTEQIYPVDIGHIGQNLCGISMHADI